MFFHLADLAGLLPALLDQDLLLIVPTDLAFARQSKGTMEELLSSPVLLVAFVQSFMLPTHMRLSSSLGKAIMLRNALEVPVMLYPHAQGLAVGTQPVAMTMQASNGQALIINDLVDLRPTTSTSTTASTTSTSESSLLDLIQSHPRLSSLHFFLLQAQLLAPLGNMPVLVAPVNDAFSRLSYPDLIAMIEGRPSAMATLRKHMLTAPLPPKLPATVVASTGAAIAVTVVEGIIRFNNAKVLGVLQDAAGTVYLVDRVI